jgi:hypothetical protein
MIIIFSLLFLFWKNKRKLMNSHWCLFVCTSPLSLLDNGLVNTFPRHKVHTEQQKNCRTRIFLCSSCRKYAISSSHNFLLLFQTIQNLIKNRLCNLKRCDKLCFSPEDTHFRDVFEFPTCFEVHLFHIQIYCLKKKYITYRPSVLQSSKKLRVFSCGVVSLNTHYVEKCFK